MLKHAQDSSRETSFVPGTLDTVTRTFDGNQLVLNLKTDAGNMAFATSTPG